MAEPQESLYAKVAEVVAVFPPTLKMLTAICVAEEQVGPGWSPGKIEGMDINQYLTILLHNGIVQRMEVDGWPGTPARFCLACPRQEMEAILTDLIKRGAPWSGDRKRVMVTPGAIEDFEQLLTSGMDAVDFWARKINPKAEGLMHVKRAILLCLASPPDTAGDRGRIHVLLYGAPGSAKTILRTWVANQLGAGSCSQRTTKVGLMGSASGAEIVPGALPRNHGGVLTIDELDKFSRQDRQGLLEAMEEGVVEVEAGGKSERFPAEVRVIACANRIKEFSPELMDRFDFIFPMEIPSGDAEKAVVSSIVHTWFREKPWYDGKLLNQYLTWIQAYRPEISDDVRKKAEALLLRLIELEDLHEETHEQEGGGSDAKPLGKRGTLGSRGIRARESILRIAYTLARLNRRGVIVEDLLRAIKMQNPDLDRSVTEELERIAREKEVLT